MNYKKNDSSVFQYLNQIDNGPLLTRKQEEELIKSIEVYQKEILEAFVKSQYSKKELKVYLESLDSSGESVVDISKKLDEESPKENVESILKIFKSLLSELNEQTVSNDQLVQLLNDVALSGTIVHGVVTEIKKKYSAILEIESKIKQIQKYMTQLSLTEVIAHVETKQSEIDDTLRREYFLNEIKIQNKINEWKQVAIEYRNLETALNNSFSEVKDAYKSISNFESLASKFKNELIEKNLRLVVSRAKGFMNRGLEFEDLIQEGNIGLMKAIDKFDSSKKTKVSTYATWWIDQSIRRAISNKGKTVRVPTHIEWMQTKIEESRKRLVSKLQRPPTQEELSVDSGYPLESLQELQTRAQHEIGLEEELANGLTLGDMLSSESSENPQSLVEKKLLREKVRDILSTLSPRHEKVIRLRFGIGEEPDAEGTTLQSIANEIGITKQGVRVVECAAFKVLRKKAKGLINE